MTLKDSMNFYILDSTQKEHKDVSHLKNDMTVGEELYKAGKLEEARVFFEKMVQEHPQNYEVINNLGTISCCQGDNISAEKYFQQAFSLKDDDNDILSNLSDFYFNLKEWGEAARFLESYLLNNPQDSSRQNQLALAYTELGKYDQVIPLIKRSLGIKPDQVDIQNTLKTLNSLPPLKSSPLIRKSAPIVSIGLPVYNGAKFLSQAIESILVQDFEDLELIISDNCSNDLTEKICRQYERQDKRIRYYRMTENLGAASNFFNVLGLAEAPYFMWTTYDDLREKTFISKCLPLFHEDPAVALVYTRTRVLDANSNFIRFHQDPFLCNQESPQERFRSLVWGLGMCNAILGIFRTSVLKKVTSWWKSIFGDTLALAEIALIGKLIQIEEPLFIRRLTRNYNYRSYDERNTQLMSDCDPKLLNEGISFPHSRLAYGHLELVNQYCLNDSDKDAMIKEVRNCFRVRYGQQMSYEIDRAVGLINQGIYYHQWNQIDCIRDRFFEEKSLSSFHISSLLKRLQEALFFFPERDDLAAAHRKCCDELFK